MKVLPESVPYDLETAAANELILPQGIIGFAEYHRAELLYAVDQLPFIWMRLIGPDTLHFVVIEPGGIIPGYEPEIFDEDAARLGLRDTTDAMVLNIVTLPGQQPVAATVNLIGPLIVNRRTRVGRQRVIANHGRYSARYPLDASSMTAIAAGSA